MKMSEFLERRVLIVLGHLLFIALSCFAAGVLLIFQHWLWAVIALLLAVVFIFSMYRYIYARVLKDIIPPYLDQRRRKK